MKKENAKHPEGNNCPDEMIYSNTKGKCINPHLEPKEYLENPASRNKSARNLKFPAAKHSNSAHIVNHETSNLKHNSYVHVDMQQKADEIMAKVRQQPERAPQSIQSEDVPGLSQPHKYTNFRAKRRSDL